MLQRKILIDSGFRWFHRLKNHKINKTLCVFRLVKKMETELFWEFSSEKK